MGKLSRMYAQKWGFPDDTAKKMAQDPLGLGYVISKAKGIALEDLRMEVEAFFVVAEKRGVLPGGRDSEWFVQRAFRLSGDGTTGSGESFAPPDAEAEADDLPGDGTTTSGEK